MISVTTIDSPANERPGRVERAARDATASAATATRTVALVGHKGGVGKTTLAINLATLAAHAGRSVLLVDLDPAGGLSSAFGLKWNDASADATSRVAATHPGSALDADLAIATGDGLDFRDAFAEPPGYVAPEPDAIRLASPTPGIDVLRSAPSSWKADVERLAAERAYDLVLVDAPPLTGESLDASLAGVDEAILTLRAEPLALRTLPDALSALVRARRRRPLHFRGVVLTMPRREPAGGQAETACRELLRGALLAVVPFDPAVGEALLATRPVVEFSPRSPAAEALAALARRLEWTAPRETDALALEAEAKPEDGAPGDSLAAALDVEARFEADPLFSDESPSEEASALDAPPEPAFDASGDRSFEPASEGDAVGFAPAPVAARDGRDATTPRPGFWRRLLRWCFGRGALLALLSAIGGAAMGIQLVKWFYTAGG